ncbi:2OG-Fe(II) oxygenase [Flagellimonas aequoris]|uniref:Prolyl 4-hydroxylase subunit alpha n=1 Tax=Flagellimonas aequoris TaxID=2306997 RepID=A0A418N362_9FLAO|nr:2OG-Fe(II) oxygenase [Allomuricauda aequoris]RIV68288.1 prolyl 4-hydroxylase subunit alpha [Allomuricauda aequoris]TXJ99977.1 prolyl 4-hydroxylase subunit alpha [Allomuricauda aequoris]
MDRISERIKQLDWENIGDGLHNKGYGLISNLLADAEVESLKKLYDKPEGYRKTVVMERYRFGLGEYKYFDYPLPEIIQTLRTELYSHLAPIANLWMGALKMDTRFPNVHQQLLEDCWQNYQTKPTPLILKYGEGGFNTLHRDLYGEVYFPMQAVLFLSEPTVDYAGGEFVLTQQTPRAQSKAIVLQPKKGDVLLFTTNFRPVQGKNGYYRVSMKHGVSELHWGERYTLGIIFHDAIS